MSIHMEIIVDFALTVSLYKLTVSPYCTVHDLNPAVHTVLAPKIRFYCGTQINVPWRYLNPHDKLPKTT